MRTILLFTQDPDLREAASTALPQESYNLSFADFVADPFEAPATPRPDAILFDLGAQIRPSWSNALGRLVAVRPSIPVIAVLPVGGTEYRALSVRKGAMNFIARPLEAGTIRRAVRLALGEARGTLTPIELPPLVGHCDAMREIIQLIARLATPDLAVLIQGETGTGKENVARLLHAGGPRAPGPFQAVDCNALTETLFEAELFGHVKGAFSGANTGRPGLFESAHGGTLFLDEIGNLTLAMQAKLLRVLDERRVRRVGSNSWQHFDVRLLSATNVDLACAVASGQFRSDLFYRIAEVSIQLPPLRDRPGDLPALADHFLRRYGPTLTHGSPALDPAALSQLERHTWPGNLRELRNVLRTACVMADGPVITPAALPPGLGETLAPASAKGTSASPKHEAANVVVRVDVAIVPGNVSVDLKAIAAEAAGKAEKAVLTTLLAQPGANISTLARRLHVDRKTVRAKLTQHSLTCTP